MSDLFPEFWYFHNHRNKERHTPATGFLLVFRGRVPGSWENTLCFLMFLFLFPVPIRSPHPLLPFFTQTDRDIRQQKNYPPKKMIFVVHPWWFQGQMTLKWRMQDDGRPPVHHDPEAAQIVLVEQQPAQAQQRQHNQQWYARMMDQEAYGHENYRPWYQARDVGEWLVSLMKEDFIEKDKDRSMHGWLPKRATCSKGSIESFLVSNFCERINKYLTWRTLSCVMLRREN